MLRLDQIAKKWKALSSAAAVVIAAATASFRPPPLGESATSLLALGGFLATVCSGLIYVAMVRWSDRKDAWRWVVGAAAGVVAAIASFQVYESQLDASVATFQGAPQVIGDRYTPEGAKHVAETGRTDPTLLLFDAGGVASFMWTSESIQRVRSRMRLTYLAGFPLVAVAILATVQAVHCALRKEKVQKKKMQKKQVKEAV